MDDVYYCVNFFLNILNCNLIEKRAVNARHVWSSGCGRKRDLAFPLRWLRWNACVWFYNTKDLRVYSIELYFIYSSAKEVNYTLLLQFVWCKTLHRKVSLLCLSQSLYCLAGSHWEVQHRVTVGHNVRQYLSFLSFPWLSGDGKI